MQLKLDVKTLVIGVALGAVLAAAIGAVGSADQADFGIALANRGRALVKAQDGALYVIDVDRAEAEIVEYESGPYRGRTFNLTRPAQPQKRSTKK